MASLRRIPPPETEFLDPRTGRISRLWYEYFFNLNVDSVAVSTTVYQSSALNVPGGFGDADQGEPGPQGVPGKDGKDGVTTFIHIHEDVPEPEPYFIRIP